MGFGSAGKKYRNNQHLSTRPDFFIKSSMELKKRYGFKSMTCCLFLHRVLLPSAFSTSGPDGKQDVVESGFHVGVCGGVGGPHGRKLSDGI
jgi:hypothetical protein